MRYTRVKDKNGATATKTITVTVVKGVTLASEIKISNKFNNLYLGASKEINAAVNKEADIKDIKWSVSDTNILNKNGIKSVNLGIGMKKAHTLEEYIAIEDLINSAVMVGEIIKEA
mgnify:CR=1 FL=1